MVRRWEVCYLPQRMRTVRLSLRTLPLPMRALLLLACLALSLPDSAHGQTDSSELSAYERAVEEALREYQLGHFEEARAGFLEAHRLSPNARTHRALGMAEFELRNYVDAIEELQAALSSRDKPLDEKARAATQELLRRWRAT